MKLNLEVELDYIDEEMNIDETIKQNIINQISDKIESKVSTKVKEVVESKIDNLIVAKVNELTDAMFKEFISRPVILTDNYGSKLKQYENIEGIVKEKFDNFLTERVDEQGRTYGGYGKNMPRIEYVIDSKLKEFAEKFTTEAVKRVSAEIQTHVKEGLTQKLGGELMKVLKVNEMLQLNGK